jgi:DNA-binding MarR family transcriptional regulator/GNAT superfamily N-acetyltransferase
MDEKLIEQVRSFNRTVTQRVGALDDSYLARGRPLGEARLIFEAGSTDGADIRVLRERLGLDSGYLSRLLRALEGQGLVEVRRKADDGRAREVHLTETGRAEFRAYDALSDDLAVSILKPLGEPERRRLVAAMAEVERLMRPPAVEVALEAPDSADARRCLDSYYAELARRFDTGFDAEAGGSFDTADMVPPHGYLVLARLDGAAVGCGALKRLSDDVGEIKRVWCGSAMRGKGVATGIMDRLEAIARELGFKTLRLDTNRTLTEAHTLYRKLGYREIGRYNDNPYAHHWFEKRL